MIFPSDDPQLMQPCPNRACMTIMEQANAYVHQKLAGRLAADYGPLFISKAHQNLRARLVDALALGDLDATKTVCRAWCKLVVTWTQQQTSPLAGTPPQGMRHDERGVDHA